MTELLLSLVGKGASKRLLVVGAYGYLTYTLALAGLTLPVLAIALGPAALLAGAYLWAETKRPTEAESGKPKGDLQE